MATKEAVFAPIAEALIAFGQRFNLHVTKYYKDSPGWLFGFRHPAGGIGSLQIMAQPPDEFLIVGHWNFDDRNSGTRHIRSTDFITVRSDNADLADVLEKMLREMASWQAGQWSKSVGGFGALWKASKGPDEYAAALSYPKL